MYTNCTETISQIMRIEERAQSVNTFIVVGEPAIQDEFERLAKKLNLGVIRVFGSVLISWNWSLDELMCFLIGDEEQMEEGTRSPPYAILSLGSAYCMSMENKTYEKYLVTWLSGSYKPYSLAEYLQSLQSESESK